MADYLKLLFGGALLAVLAAALTALLFTAVREFWRQRPRGQYGPLRRKIFWQMLGLAFGSLALLVFIHTQLPSGIIANTGVWLLVHLLRMDHWAAVEVYNRVVYGNYSFIMAAAVLAVFLVFMRFALGWFLRYFAQIERGLDTLLAEDGRPVVLSPDLRPLEQRFNTVRETLERRRLESKLAEQRKNDLVMYLAHDIRTPLTSVLGYLSLLDEAPDMPAEQRAKYTGIALAKARRLEALVNEFFEITRYNLSEMPLERQHLDLCCLLRQLTDEFYPALTAHGNTLTLQAPDTLPLYGDADKLARVFNNLLKNAVAYSYPGTAITVQAAAGEGGITVRVTNRGPTIPPERMQAVFERFFRLDSARPSENGGSSGGAGLGLAIAKEIVTRHGGTITAESADEITTFTVTLPAPPQENPNPALAKP